MAQRALPQHVEDRNRQHRRADAVAGHVEQEHHEFAVAEIGITEGVAADLGGRNDEPFRVRHRIRSRVEIPDFSSRRDEIGHLSRSLRDMTNALYSRIEAIESFAADVSHELKNPLTSLRSAVETLPLAKTENSRARLLAVIEHDVKRLDRLISDISDASRLDAELQRQDAAPVDLRRLLTTLTLVANETRLGHDVAVEVRFEGAAADSFSVPGHDSRLGQVISNLLTNAQSFSSAGGSCLPRLSARRRIPAQAFALK